MKVTVSVQANRLNDFGSIFAAGDDYRYLRPQGANAAQ
jgi:hypothetical protein